MVKNQQTNQTSSVFGRLELDCPLRLRSSIVSATRPGVEYPTMTVKRSEAMANDRLLPGPDFQTTTTRSCAESSNSSLLSLRRTLNNTLLTEIFSCPLDLLGLIKSDGIYFSIESFNIETVTVEGNLDCYIFGGRRGFEFP